MPNAIPGGEYCILRFARIRYGSLHVTISNFRLAEDSVTASRLPTLISYYAAFSERVSTSRKPHSLLCAAYAASLA